MESRFFAIFLATVFVTRLALYLWPTAAPTIGGIRTHHYMYGAVAVLAGLLTRSIAIYAMGVGLFIDELTFLVIGGQTHQDNYSALSLGGTAALVLVAFFLRSLLARPFLP